MIVERGFLSFVKGQVEPSGDVPCVIINSASHVTVVPEYRQNQIRPVESLPSESEENSAIPKEDLKSGFLVKFIRSIGNFAYSSAVSTGIPNILKDDSENQIDRACKLALIPGRHRRLFRIEACQTNKNLGVARINRTDWLFEDDRVNAWPSLFVAKLTIYRTGKEARTQKTRETISRRKKI